MIHVVEVRLRLHLDEAEFESGDTPTLAAERLFRDNNKELAWLHPEEKSSLEFTELVR